MTFMDTHDNPNDKGYRMRQCRFARELPEGKYQEYTAWIPADKAVKGKEVTIKGHGTWTVAEVGAEGFSKALIENSNAHKKHRIATDV